MGEIQPKPHALLLPYPLQGHVIPFIHLATKLASNGFIITFVITESIHHQITRSKNQTNHYKEGGINIFAEARKSGLDIRYATVSDGFPLGFDRSLNHDQFFEGIVHVFSAHVDEIVGKLVQSDPPVNCLVIDTFYVFASPIARKYNLVNISFWTEPALVFTLYYHMDLLRINGHYDNYDKREDIITYIPGVESIKPTDLTSYLQTDPTTVVHRLITKAFVDIRNSDFVISNTIDELEPQIISVLRENQPFYSIGPILPTGLTKSSVPVSMWSESDCGPWLDTKPKGSVLYISFGSYAHTSKHNIVEIAHGLLLSEVNFVWVLRPDIISSEETDYLPTGYDRLIEYSGMIVPWCSQVDVLSHPAVGGFLTHCGWNSILESIWSGVPMICYPLLTDQFTNRKLVVDDWKIGVNLHDKRSVTREEIAENIRCVMSGKSSDRFKQEIKKVKKTLENALARGGSSQKNLNQFTMDVKKKIRKNQ
ncbi:UDP-glycosyltransferase 86A1-like [Coffea arabica]|uniref:Glycosyltransferase n=1 Tax=Coffea arabica TaxID=13443 RepID=A0A6P6SZ82_COFAR|nr:UDP-glycosyltransferase 86A1-like [Coffea arabica]